MNEPQETQSAISSGNAPVLLTVREVAGICRLAEPTIRKLAASEKLPSIEIGGSIRFRRDAIESLIGPLGD
ncbi:helix-turn-helix domain-containing protein [Planctomycetes bacterium TBK1r]|uniref:Helix-turn-helix domain protein n=1 Tax=Stieleria magnilauensis TaxID=2527963 RepID=A0ABX5Y0W4_9BACT|nr:Helix-turn-helix domain protein [Planctomycetes bacterium TBK1r]